MAGYPLPGAATALFYDLSNVMQAGKG